MNANERRLIKMIQKGEGIDLEFKTCRKQLNRDVYETVCAFLNRHGGTILLGVTDSGDIQGIEPDAVLKIKKDFVTTINNPQKIHPPAYLAIDEVAVQEKPVLRIYVPESSQVHRCNGRIYDRNEDGDLDITDHTLEVAALYQRKQAIYQSGRELRSHHGICRQASARPLLPGGHDQHQHSGRNLPRGGFQHFNPQGIHQRVSRQADHRTGPGTY